MSLGQFCSSDRRRRDFDFLFRFQIDEEHWSGGVSVVGFSARKNPESNAASAADESCVMISDDDDDGENASNIDSSLPPPCSEREERGNEFKLVGSWSSSNRFCPATTTKIVAIVGKWKRILHAMNQNNKGLDLIRVCRYVKNESTNDIKKYAME